MIQIMAAAGFAQSSSISHSSESTAHSAGVMGPPRGAHARARARGAHRFIHLQLHCIDRYF